MLKLSRDIRGTLHLQMRLTRPVVYLDHWAVRLLSDKEVLGDNFASALHRAGGTLLFSQANLFEFAAMNSIGTARQVERFLEKVLPALYVADTSSDKAFIAGTGIKKYNDVDSANAPDQNWMLKDLLARAEIRGGKLNMHRFISDAIDHRHLLLPEFEDLKKQISGAIISLTLDPHKRTQADNFVPVSGMTLHEVLLHELIRQPLIDPTYQFTENDAMDLVHAVPACLASDYVLLDKSWCHKIRVATSRISRAGITGNIAQCFTQAQLPVFLAELGTKATQ